MYANINTHTFMYFWLHTYLNIYIHMHTCTLTFLHIFIDVCLYTDLRKCLCILHLQTHMHSVMSGYMDTYKHTCRLMLDWYRQTDFHACLFIYTCIYTSIHMDIQTCLSTYICIYLHVNMYACNTYIRHS